MNELIHSIKRKISGMLSDWALPATTKEERARITALRNGIRALPPLNVEFATTSEQEWNKNRTELRSNILKRDPRNFLCWPVVTYTMFHESNVAELEYLKHLSNWTEYESALAESVIGNPRRYPAFPTSSGNLIHHAYSIALFSEKFSVNIRDCQNIFEFGGGYGSLTRFAYQLGFTGQYIIFDLPEFSLLQKYYLSSMPKLGLHFDGLGNPRTVSLTTTVDQSLAVITGKLIDLFVALWSLSESPIAFRDSMLAKLPHPSYFLIAYQKQFNNINNVDYFKKFAQERPDYEWVDFPILHLPGSHYLVGKKNKV